jgi:hypothetical protein
VIGSAALRRGLSEQISGAPVHERSCMMLQDRGWGGQCWCVAHVSAGSPKSVHVQILTEVQHRSCSASHTRRSATTAHRAYPSHLMSSSSFLSPPLAIAWPSLLASSGAGSAAAANSSSAVGAAASAALDDAGRVLTHWHQAQPYVQVRTLRDTTRVGGVVSVTWS